MATNTGSAGSANGAITQYLAREKDTRRREYGRMVSAKNAERESCIYEERMSKAVPPHLLKEEDREKDVRWRKEDCVRTRIWKQVRANADMIDNLNEDMNLKVRILHACPSSHP
jgi:hypothetical protein